jgi:hypothetical protein
MKKEKRLSNCLQIKPCLIRHIPSGENLHNFALAASPFKSRLIFITTLPKAKAKFESALI